MISVGALSILIYLALGFTVLAPVLLLALLILDIKRGRLW